MSSDNVRHRIQPLHAWRKLCALSLTATYGSLFLFAALCLATDIFHPGAHGDHDHASQHHHTDADSSHRSAPEDICDFARQCLTTTAWHAVEQQTVTFPTVEIVKPPNSTVCFTDHDVSPSIRAPPHIPA